jgi:hypothetical protein
MGDTKDHPYRTISSYTGRTRRFTNSEGNQPQIICCFSQNVYEERQGLGGIGILPMIHGLQAHATPDGVFIHVLRGCVKPANCGMGKMLVPPLTYLLTVRATCGWR